MNYLNKIKNVRIRIVTDPRQTGRVKGTSLWVASFSLTNREPYIASLEASNCVGFQRSNSVTIPSKYKGISKINVDTKNILHALKSITFVVLS